MVHHFMSDGKAEHNLTKDSINVEPSREPKQNRHSVATHSQETSKVGSSLGVLARSAVHKAEQNYMNMEAVH